MKFFKKKQRAIVIFGRNKKTDALEFFFKNNNTLYIHKKTFDLNTPTSPRLDSCFQFINEAHIDEIYCSPEALTAKQLNQIIHFSEKTFKTVKLLTDETEICSKAKSTAYYGDIPIVSLRETPLDNPYNQFIKRVFDIIFSLLVIVLLLSWLTPILALLIKLESKGPVFFKQPRNGLNYKTFHCYKFRSMKKNENAHSQRATLGDTRVTWIGKFIRKASIDEFPQFFNVLLGHMSVIGPRPLMVNMSLMYEERIDNFVLRHSIRPGITGLAQVSGARGEMKIDQDMVNRLRYDLFYIENWSFLLDLKIVIKTIINLFKSKEVVY